MRLSVSSEWNQQQSGDEQSEREERDVSRSRRKHRRVERAERDSLQESPRQSLKPSAFLTIKPCQQQVLEDEGCCEENGEASHQSSSIEPREQVVPERPQKKEREEPVEQSPFWQH